MLKIPHTILQRTHICPAFGLSKSSHAPAQNVIGVADEARSAICVFEAKIRIALKMTACNTCGATEA